MFTFSRRSMAAIGASGIILLSGLGGGGGCIGVGGRDRYFEYTSPTLGQQLIDLKTARDTGAISQPEYQQAKDDLLHGRQTSASAR